MGIAAAPFAPAAAVAGAAVVAYPSSRPFPGPSSSAAAFAEAVAG